MWKIISFFLFLFCSPALSPGAEQELEIRLPTRSPLTPIYLSGVYAEPTQSDWRYLEELRNVLEFDFNVNGFSSTLEKQEQLEALLHFPDLRSHFDLSVWRKERIPFVLAIQVRQNHFNLIVFNVEKGTSKKYPDIPLSGKVERDRQHLHRLADTVQKDLFGQEGIASLKILYAQRSRNLESAELDWSSEIYVCDADGANARQLTSENSYCLSPLFLPTSGSSEFSYVSYKLGQSKIYRASLANPKGEVMVQLRGSQALPAINRKGNQIAFITDLAGRPDLFVQNLDAEGKMSGKARQLYSSPRATQASPTYSPDGKQIAFVSDKDGSPRIYLIDIPSPKETKKLHPRLLTKKNRENTSPAWSPDGAKLAYSAKVDGIRQIWLYDFASDEEYPLTTTPETKENPSWAPDSLHLVYNTESEDTCELYLVNLNSREPIQISKGTGQKRFPSWGSTEKSEF